jgi:hypothetical protein
MRLLPSLIAVGALAGISLAFPAMAAPVNAGKCFFISQFENWKAADDHTMYISAGLNQYYRIDLSGRCPALMWPDSHLVTRWRGSSSVCSALDWDLKISQGATRGFAQPCIVKSMTPLTAEQASAIPKKLRP